MNEVASNPHDIICNSRNHKYPYNSINNKHMVNISYDMKPALENDYHNTS